MTPPRNSFAAEAAPRANTANHKNGGTNMNRATPSGTKPSGTFTTRRNVMRLGAVAGGALLTARARAQTPKLEDTLVFACNGGGTQTVFEKQIWPEFSKRTGVSKLVYLAGQAGDNLSKLRVQKNSPAIDVLWMAGATTYQAIDEKLVVPFDPALVPNYRFTQPALATEKAAVAIGVTVCSLLYNTKTYAQKGFAAPSSWWDMWDPKLKGHVGCYSINTSAAAGFIAKLSMMLTGQYKNVDAAFAKLKQLRPNMLNFYTSSGAFDTATQQGDLWLEMNTSVRGQQMKDEGQPIGFVTPKEGFVGYQGWAGVVNKAPHPNVAHAWLDYLLSTEVQNKIPELIGYSPANQQAQAPDRLKLYFPDLKDVFVPDWRFIQTQLPAWVDRWNREIEG